MFQPVSLPFRIRQSTLNDAKCLFRFHESHILGHREPDSDAAGRGTQVHALAKRYVDYLVASRQEVDWGYADELLAEHDWDTDAAQIFKYWTRGRSFEPQSIFATEYKVRLGWDLRPCLPEDAVFSADMDMVEMVGDHATIHDWKTNWAAFEPHTAQAIIYPWMMFHLMPHLNRITFSLEFMRWGIVRSRDFRRDHLEQMDWYVKNQVSRLLSAYHANEWPAAVNSTCVYCRLECPLVKAGLSRQMVGQVQTPEQAQSMAQQLYALTKTAKQLQAILRAYASEAGPFEIGNDITLGFTKREKKVYDPQTIVKLNKEHGFDELRGLTVNPKEVRKVGRDYPEYVTAAQASAKDRSSTVFQFRSDVGDPLELDDEEFDYD